MHLDVQKEKAHPLPRQGVSGALLQLDFHYEC